MTSCALICSFVVFFSSTPIFLLKSDNNLFLASNFYASLHFGFLRPVPPLSSPSSYLNPSLLPSTFPPSSHFPSFFLLHPKLSSNVSHLCFFIFLESMITVYHHFILSNITIKLFHISWISKIEKRLNISFLVFGIHKFIWNSQNDNGLNLS